MGRSRSNRIYAIIAGIFFFLIMGSRISQLYIDRLWFHALGQGQVFDLRLLSPWLIGLLIGSVIGALFYANLMVTRPNFLGLPYNVVPLEIRRWLAPAKIRRLFLYASILIAFFFGIGFGNNWLALRLFLAQTPFDKPADPLFGLNPSFYIFTLPILQLVYQFLMLLLFLLFVTAAAVYVVNGELGFTGRDIVMHRRARKHLSLLAALLALAKAGGYLISRYELVFSERGAAFGASYTDVHALLPVMYVLAALAAVLAVLLLIHTWQPVTKPLIYTFAAFVAVSLLGGSVYPAFVQQVIVKPNELALERPYLANNINMTLAAWNLDQAEIIHFPAVNDLEATGKALRNNPRTIENIRVWDWRLLQSSYQQLQAIRPYYRFREMDVDRYRIDGELRQTILSAREIAYNQLPAGSDTWVNRHLKYTHGYGVVVTPAGSVTRDGMPPFWISDIPPRSSTSLTVEQPAIYYGELTDVYALVGTKEAEFDYPDADIDAEGSGYQGKGGIRIGGLLQRIAFAWSTGDINILLSRSITSETKALIHREVTSRIKMLAPFLLYDPDPYLTIIDGRLVWIQDAYTVSGRYPYSAPYGNTGINYMNNSVKAVVDAYDGDVQFYITDPSDPLIRAYRSVFPSLFQDVSSAPAEIREHFRYPETLFTAQLDIYAKYHMTNPDVFYNRGDLWERPRELFSNQPQIMDPYYVVVQLPNMDEPSFMLMSPMTPAGTPNNPRDNMIAWIAGEAGPNGENRLLVYQLPKDKTVYGPMQIESRINQDAVISEQLNLWNQQGSQVVRGNLLVIPVGESLLYVEPVYLQSTSAQLPELRRVIVVYGDYPPVMAPTLQEAIDRLFGERDVVSPDEGDPDADEHGRSELPDDGAQGRLTDERDQDTDSVLPDTELPRSAQEQWDYAHRLYTRAVDALRNGDWTEYGRAIEELGRILEQMSR